MKRLSKKRVREYFNDLNLEVRIVTKKEFENLIDRFGYSGVGETTDFTYRMDSDGWVEAVNINAWN